jgi:hypothetical protein
MSGKISRRRMLRGALGGMAVSVGLPFLDCLLNDNGTALAATGRPLPVRFGTWFWGLGYTPSRWIPQKIGADYDLQPELKYIEPYKHQINILSGFDVKLDGKPNTAHYAGTFGFRTGTAADEPDRSQLPTFDVIIADAIGNDTRFKSLEVASTGNNTDSYSRRTVNDVNPGEGSPVQFYMRVFGPDFRDPNAAEAQRAVGDQGSAPVAAAGGRRRGSRAAGPVFYLAAPGRTAAAIAAPEAASG